MDAEEFYAEFKASLDYLGAGWSGRDQVVVSIEGDKFRMAFGGRETLLVLPVSGAPSTTQTPAAPTLPPNP